MADTSTAPSILIIGAGIFGTSTAYHLSLTHPSPSRITVLDRSPYPPHHAASTDINKIVRADYSVPFYMDLAYEALDAWKTWPVLQSPSGNRFFHNSGWIMLANHGNDLAERIRHNLRQRGSDNTSDVAIDEGLRKKWEALLKETDLQYIETGYWNPDAGWANAGDAVKRMMEDAVSRGVKYEADDVDVLLLGDHDITGVRTKTGRIHKADKVLLATGAWTSQLLSPIEDALKIPDEERIERQLTAAGVTVVHYELDTTEYERLRDMPVIVYGDRGEVLPPPQEGQLLKFTNARSFTNIITTPSGHKISVPPDRDQTIVSKQLKKETLDLMVKTTIPGFIDRRAKYWRLCWDSITPTQDQLLTKHPHSQLSNLYIAAGGSFHSWKFLPIIGKYIVNVLNGVSNGKEKDARWVWKMEEFGGRGAHEKVIPQRELRGLEDSLSHL
jgi:sarcosine oxidase / L-pipecolate oxidase